MVRVISIASHKGGVGKTSMCCWLADALSRSGLHVLIIDGDPQGAASDAFGWDGSPGDSLAEWYLNPKNAKGLIWKKHDSKIHLVPNCMNAFVSAHKLETQASSAKWSIGSYLRHFVQHVQDDYDLILIDTPPHWDIHLLNCLRASQTVLIPLAPDSKSLKGVQILLGLIAREKNREVEMPDVLGLCVHRTKPKTRTCRDITQLLRDTYKEVVLKIELSDSVCFSECDAAGCISPLSHKPGSPTADQILSLTEEIGKRLENGETWQANKLCRMDIE